MTIESRIVKTPIDTDGCEIKTDDYYELPYEALLASADPANWPKIAPWRFLRMVSQPDNAQGWSRFIEHGKFGFITARTPLKFWKSFADNGYRIDYDLDTDCDPADCDPWVKADKGYIWVQPERSGARVRTSKLFDIRGFSPLLASTLLPMMGWADEGHRFFHSAVTCPEPVAFEVSQVLSRGETHE